MHLRRFLFFLCSCFLLGPPFLAAQNVQKPFSLNAANQCAQISTAGQATVGIQVSGTWSATLQPQVSIGGGAATNTSVTPTGSTSSQNTITANGVYSASVAAVDAFFLCVSAYSSGTITGVLTISPAINANLFGGGGAGGAVNSVSGDGTIYNNSSSTGNVTLTLANTPTGTGGVVLKTSPTLVTPNLGTPSAGVITSLTGTCANCGANTVDSAVSSTNASYSILTGSATSGQQEPNTIASFTINPSTGAMNVPGALTVSSCSGCGGRLHLRRAYRQHLGHGQPAKLNASEHHGVNRDRHTDSDEFGSLYQWPFGDRRCQRRDCRFRLSQRDRGEHDDLHQ